MKTKKHRFTVIVETTGSKGRARSALLCAFASRQPDGCAFYVKAYRKPPVEVHYVDPTYRA